VGNSKLLRISKAADLLGVTPQTLRVWDAAGTIKVVRSPGGHRLVPMSEVDRLLAESGQHACKLCGQEEWPTRLSVLVEAETGREVSSGWHCVDRDGCLVRQEEDRS